MIVKKIVRPKMSRMCLFFVVLGHVEHVVDVVKSQDELIRGLGLNVQLPTRHLSRVKRLSWFFQDEKALFSGQHIFMKSP